MRKRKEKISAQSELCCSCEHTHAHTRNQAHISAAHHTVEISGDWLPSSRDNSTGQHEEFIASMKRQKCAHTACAQTLLLLLTFFKLEEDFKLVSSVGEKWHHCIIGGFFSSSFFSLHVRALSGKFRSDPFHKCIVFPLFPVSESLFSSF